MYVRKGVILAAFYFRILLEVNLDVNRKFLGRLESPDSNF